MAKVLERFGTWAERNSTRLHDAMMSFRSATPGQNDSVVDAREGSLGSSASERKEAMEEWTQWLRCNSPLTGAYVFGSGVMPVAMVAARAPFVSRVTSANPRWNAWTKRFGNQPVELGFYYGFDIEDQWLGGWFITQNVFERHLGRISISVDSGFEGTFGDPEIAAITQVGSLPIPGGPVPLSASAKFTPGGDEAEISISAGAGFGSLEAEGGLTLAFSLQKVKNLIDIDRWTGKKATDCGEGEETERRFETDASLDQDALRKAASFTDEERAACLATLSNSSLQKIAQCNNAALSQRETFVSLAQCLKSGGGRACLTGSRVKYCGPESNGGFDCDVDATLRCICYGGGVSCMRPSKGLCKPRASTRTR